MRAAVDAPFAAYSVGLCYASVCTSLDDEAASVALNDSHPTGVSPWVIADESFADGSPNPTPCNLSPTSHRHILFNC